LNRLKVAKDKDDARGQQDQRKALRVVSNQLQNGCCLECGAKVGEGGGSSRKKVSRSSDLPMLII
jgi:hypothetical protein